jgi:hypothetical protein
MINCRRLSSTIVLLMLTTGATTGATPILAAEIGDTVGTWKNDQTGETITIKPDFDVQDSLLGPGHAIDPDQMFGATISITYQGPIVCWFFVAMTNQNKGMNLAVRGIGSNRDPKCLGGDFNLVP